MAKQNCMHHEDSFILYGNTLVCQRCEEEAAVQAPVVDDTGVFMTNCNMLPTPVPVMSEEEAEEVETTTSILTTRAASADCQGRREDALALRLALHTIRHLSGRMTPVIGTPKLRLVA